MNLHTVGVILNHELRMLLRDRRTVILAIVLPILIMPLMLFASRYMYERREKALEQIVYKYAVSGTLADQVRELISTHRSRLVSRPASEEDIQYRFQEVSVSDASKSLRDGEIHFYLRALSGTEADEHIKERRAEEQQDKDPEVSEKSSGGQEEVAGVPMVRLFFQGDRDNSQAGRSKMRDLLLEARREEQSDLLGAAGFTGDPSALFPIEEQDLASASEVTGSYIGRFMTLVLTIFILVGGSVVAMDIIAGEKERGSLETLLTTAARRTEIVTAKQLAILIVALLITLIQIVNILIYLNLEIIELPQDWSMDIAPAAIITLIFLFLPFAALFASILLMISAYAKTYKEAQLYFFPIYLVSMVPALAGVLPGISLRSAIVLVPVANVSVAVREVMIGEFDWLFLLITFLVMTTAAAWAARLSGKLLGKENLVTATDSDAADFQGGSSLFSKHVLRWYAVMGVVMFSVALNVPQLATFRPQILFNELVIFLAASILMIRIYRLDFREALALRRVKPTVWLAVLLAIPCANVVATGVFRIADLFFPVPQQMLEQFGREILPADVPLWQMLFFIAVLPGICEEIAFRGTLLYGLRKKFRPVPLIFIVGVIFGLFHLSLFRIIPTAFLGVILTAIALLTGSILPGIALHIGNNALAFFLSRSKIPLSDFQWWGYALASLLFALALYIIYRVRTPYPDLRIGSRHPNRNK